MEPLKKVQVEGSLMFAEPPDLFGNLDELSYVRLCFIYILTVSHLRVIVCSWKINGMITNNYRSSLFPWICTGAITPFDIDYIFEIHYDKAYETDSK